MDFDEFVWRRGISLKKMAKAIGATAMTLSNIKNYKTHPTLDMALRIEAFCGGEVTTKDLLTPEKFIELNNLKSYKDLDVASRKDNRRALCPSSA